MLLENHNCMMTPLVYHGTTDTFRVIGHCYFDEHKWGEFDAYEKLNWYCDPPYPIEGKKIYGEYGDIDHYKLAEHMKKIKGDFVLSYENNPHIKKLYHFCRFHKIEMYSSRKLKRGTTGFKQLS